MKLEDEGSRLILSLPCLRYADLFNIFRVEEDAQEQQDLETDKVSDGDSRCRLLVLGDRLVDLLVDVACDLSVLVYRPRDDVAERVDDVLADLLHRRLELGPGLVDELVDVALELVDLALELLELLLHFAVPDVNGVEHGVQVRPNLVFNFVSRRRGVDHRGELRERPDDRLILLSLRLEIVEVRKVFVCEGLLVAVLVRGGNAGHEKSDEHLWSNRRQMPAF